jgi:hypothetical protein
MKQELEAGRLPGAPFGGEGGDDGDWQGAGEGDGDDNAQISRGGVEVAISGA